MLQRLERHAYLHQSNSKLPVSIDCSIVVLPYPVACRCYIPYHARSTSCPGLYILVSNDRPRLSLRFVILEQRPFRRIFGNRQKLCVAGDII